MIIDIQETRVCVTRMFSGQYFSCRYIYYIHQYFYTIVKLQIDNSNINTYSIRIELDNWKSQLWYSFTNLGWVFQSSWKITSLNPQIIKN